MVLSLTEENYIKSIFKISERDGEPISTNALAHTLAISAASTTDMVQKLSEKGLLMYQKYKGVSLSQDGRKIATDLVRKHRLWEVFLVDKLQYNWSEVHDIAEQLEHVKSTSLVEKLDAFLGFPKFDPHGDPIPDARGRFMIRNQKPLSKATRQTRCFVVGVANHSKSYLDYLDELGIKLGTSLFILDKIEFDNSLKIELNNRMITLSEMIASQLLVKES